MKTITLRELARDPKFGRLAHTGQSFLVTHRGQPYFRILPPSKPTRHVGAGAHLAKGPALSPDPIPARKWKGLGDPFDRAIVATARCLDLTLITADPAIRDAGACRVEYYPFKPSRLRR